jgi:DedD protein
MEKKTTQRIIGAMVVGSLVVIALPLFFGKGEAPGKVATTEVAPAVQVAADTNQTAPTAIPAQDTTAPQAAPTPTQDTIAPQAATASTQDTTTPQTATAPTQDTTTPPQPTPAQPAPAAVPPTQTTTPAQQTTTVPASSPNAAANSADNNSVEITQQVIDSVKTNTPVEEGKTTITIDKKPLKSKVAAQKSVHQQSIAKLHQTAWVVQMGSFKSKDNAKRLTNKLRAAGFKAFMSTAKNGDKERTRVLVGPEYKQASATQTSSRVNQAIKMKGIVVPYKPLAI